VPLDNSISRAFADHLTSNTPGIRAKRDSAKGPETTQFFGAIQGVTSRVRAGALA
jgi:hypothetical protein